MWCARSPAETQVSLSKVYVCWTFHQQILQPEGNVPPTSRLSLTTASPAANTTFGQSWGLTQSVTDHHCSPLTPWTAALWLTLLTAKELALVAMRKMPTVRTSESFDTDRMLDKWGGMPRYSRSELRIYSYRRVPTDRH